MPTNAEEALPIWWKGGLKLVAVVAAMGGLSWFGFASVQMWSDPFDDRAFDRAIWIRMQGSVAPDNPRGRMVDDLVDHLEKQRLTRDQVIGMLGPSEFSCGVRSPPIGREDTCLSYNVGMWTGWRMDYDTLDVYFGVDGRVLKAVTVQH